MKQINKMRKRISSDVAQALKGIVVFFWFLLILYSPSSIGQNIDNRPSLDDIGQLKIAILKVLKETNTPAAGIALVDRNGPIWIEGLGQANIEQSISADEETMFRIGSTSKIFIALAILKLQEEGKLKLTDKVSDLVPEIEFSNPWEDTDPILVEHLLEHTTGWDDLHPGEFAHNDPELISLRAGLDYHPHSRISKWVPGSRMAYANSGPAVAAYIVEKITGHTYEEYIKKNFFIPMGMKTMTFFPSQEFEQKGATLYENGWPQDYWHLITRATGSINASPEDMAKWLLFFINRGKIDTSQLISVNSLQRMETPSTTPGAKAGLDLGYGLCLYTSPHNGHIYYKHGGGLKGGISDFSYLPEHGVGYSVQINSGNVKAIFMIADLIRNFQTKDLPAAVDNIKPTKEKIAFSFNGYFQPVNPRKNMSLYLPPLLSRRVWVKNDTLYSQLPAHIGGITKYTAINENLLRPIDAKIPNMAIVNDPLEGKVLEVAAGGYGTTTLASIPGILFFGRLLVLIIWMLFMVRALFLSPFWILRYMRGKLRDNASIQVRLWPVAAIFTLLAVMFLAMLGIMDAPELINQPTLTSYSIMLLTIGFFGISIFSLFTIFKYRKKQIKSSVYIPATILSALNTIVALYLLWHGVIGVRTWA